GLLMLSGQAHAQLAEVENAGNWVLAIFSPAVLLVGLTILLIGCGLAVWFGRMSGGLFVKILVGSVLVFGARTIAPQLVAAFGA
ncbi:MAG: TrbC/VirB2 family protein, partial [Flavobacteriaceae bacterium]